MNRTKPLPLLGLLFILVTSALIAQSQSSFICDPNAVLIRVSVGANGVQSNGDSRNPAVSANQRYVAFSSDAANLVPNDGNDKRDIFVYDRQTCAVELVSRSSSGAQGDDTSDNPALSADGRFVAFESLAGNLVELDGDSYTDVFVHDRQTGVTQRISSDPNSGLGRDSSFNPSISADGRFIAYNSRARSLHPNGANGTQVYLFDRQTGRNTLISRYADGTAMYMETDNPVISANGRFVVYQALDPLVSNDSNRTSDIFLYDRIQETIQRISNSASGAAGNEASFAPSISADGRFIAFGSRASNLASGDTPNAEDVFVHDRQTGQTVLASVRVGAMSPQANFYINNISANGAFVVFSDAVNRFNSSGTGTVYVRDLQANTTRLVSTTYDGKAPSNRAYSPVISPDGTFVLYESRAFNLIPGDANSRDDIFIVRWGWLPESTSTPTPTQTPSQTVTALYASPSPSNTASRTPTGSHTIIAPPTFTPTPIACEPDSAVISLLPRGLGGTLANRQAQLPSVSANGHYVAFNSDAANLASETNGYTQAYVYDRYTCQTTLVSVDSSGRPGNGDAFVFDISGDGRFVVFQSRAALTSGAPSGIVSSYIHDRQMGVTSLISRGMNGAQANNSSGQSAISDTGRYIAFLSFASNLVPNDTNEKADLFVYDRETDQTTRVSVNSQSEQSAGGELISFGNRVFDISSNSRYIIFTSSATNLVLNDTNTCPSFGTPGTCPDVFVHDRETGQNSARFRFITGRTGERALVLPIYL